MSFELTKPILDRIRTDVDEGRDSSVQELLRELHPADIGSILDRLTLEEAVYVYRLLEPEEAAEVLLELDESRREELLGSLTSREIAEDPAVAPILDRLAGEGVPADRDQAALKGFAEPLGFRRLNFSE